MATSLACSSDLKFLSINSGNEMGSVTPSSVTPGIEYFDETTTLSLSERCRPPPMRIARPDMRPRDENMSKKEMERIRGGVEARRRGGSTKSEEERGGTSKERRRGGVSETSRPD
jgi:hypothetical protein